MLKRLKLWNIRSYKEPALIEFTDGTSLFEGDIGSGKSSILSAIEFALFGLGDIDGRHLLRVGEKQGGVELEFEVNREPFTVGRTLVRRRKRVSQKNCFIVERGVKTEYSATEMKLRVLGILNFREPPNPRSQSVIYRYAVFTPQEMMKEVIRQKPDRRKETLRRAFGIEEYSKASANSGVLSSWLRAEIRALERSGEELKRVEVALEGETARLEAAVEALEKAEQRRQMLQEERERLQEEISEKEEEEKELRDLESALKVIASQISQAEKNIKGLKREIERIEGRIEEAETARKTLEALTPEYKRYGELKNELPTLEPKHEEYQSTEHEKSLAEQRIESGRQSLQQRVDQASKRLSRVSEEIEGVKKRLEGLEAIEEEARSLKKETANIEELTGKSTELKKAIERLRQSEVTARGESRKRKREWRNIEKIGVGAKCPRCKQTLNPDHYQKLKAMYEEEVKALSETIKEMSGKLKQSEVEDEKLEQELLGLKEKNRRLNEVNLKIAELRTQQLTLQAKEAETEKMEEGLERLKEQLRDDAFAKELKEQLKTCMERLKALLPHIERYEEVRKEVKGLEESRIEARYTEARGKAERKTEFQEEKNRVQGEMKSAEDTVNELKGKQEEKNREYDEKKHVLSELEQLREQEKTLTKREAGNLAEIATRGKEAELTEKSIKERKDEVKRLERDLRKAEAYKQLRIWLNQYFAPALGTIEQSVLLSINQEFDELFRKWFEELVEVGELTTRIDEEFTPVVAQGGYELDVESLSGGEKTSVALAYRLALNTMVKRISYTMESNLLILDEPTDGFSREQLFKLREIFDELRCEQVILVSHERELEGVADHIYRVTKEGGISTVSRP